MEQLDGNVLLRGEPAALVRVWSDFDVRCPAPELLQLRVDLLFDRKAQPPGNETIRDQYRNRGAQ